MNSRKKITKRLILSIRITLSVFESYINKTIELFDDRFKNIFENDDAISTVLLDLRTKLYLQNSIMGFNKNECRIAIKKVMKDIEKYLMKDREYINNVQFNNSNELDQILQEELTKKIKLNIPLITKEEKIEMTVNLFLSYNIIWPLEYK